MRILLLTLFATAFFLPAPAAAQEKGVETKAEGVVRQPFKDIGALKENPPEILLDSQRAPYSLNGIRTCRDVRLAIGQLDEVLGPDVDATDERGDPLPGRLAEAGARSVVNSLIPFRGLVREATGAAESDRRFRTMVAAATARRGFLKGYAQGRACRI
ncbi:hypothetical protein ACUJ46_10300 [Sandaracinobacteroides sp. A072]|uniref:hypothetical protein n=1 Tax=Sandaracinobacteroides sp. A072 TaxID=3461146 RepID=UPI004042BFD8